MQLYKSRTFGEFFSDTFTFMKRNGKHFFKHYFVINGAVLLTFIALLFIAFYFFGDFLGFGGVRASGVDFDNFANENASMFVVIFGLLIVVGLIMGGLNYTFTPIYLKLYAENGKEFGTANIIGMYKKNLGKIIIFFLVCIVLSIPTIIAAAIPYLVLMFTFVGVYWLIAIIIFMYNGAFMEYLNGEKGIFECFSYSLSLIFGKKFWAASGAMWLFYLMISIIIAIPVVILYMFFLVSFITDAQVGNGPENTTAFMTVLLLVYTLFLLFAVIANNFYQLNQGIVFYSLKEEKENINTKSIIDEIGASEE